MDQDAALRELMDDLVELNMYPQDQFHRNSAAEHLRALATWLEQGGAPPAIDRLAGPHSYRLEKIHS